MASPRWGCRVFRKGGGGWAGRGARRVAGGGAGGGWVGRGRWPRSPIGRGGVGIAFAVSAVFVLWGVFFTDNLSQVASAVLGYLIEDLGWVFILSTFAFLVFVVFLAFSRYGRIRLGGDDDRPEFKTVSWIAMMFSAGMGIGLMFFGVAAPVC